MKIPVEIARGEKVRFMVDEGVYFECQLTPYGLQVRTAGSRGDMLSVNFDCGNQAFLVPLRWDEEVGRSLQVLPRTCT